MNQFYKANPPVKQFSNGLAYSQIFAVALHTWKSY